MCASYFPFLYILFVSFLNLCLTLSFIPTCHLTQTIHYIAHTYVKSFFFKYCHMQGVARHWRKPVRTRVTPLDSSDTLYIVYLAYTVKFMYYTVRRFQHPCVRPVRFTHTTNISSTCALDARTYCQFSLCVSSTCASNCAFYARIYY